MMLPRRNRAPSRPHERLHLFLSKPPIFVAIHCLENSFVSRLKLRQLDSAVAIAIHQSKNHAHHHGRPHPATHASSHHAAAHRSHHAPTHHPFLPHHVASHRISLSHRASGFLTSG